MDKIDFTGLSPFNPPFRQKAETKKSKSELRRTDKARVFSDIMDSYIPMAELGPLPNLAPSEETLTKLMDAVHSTGSDLLDRPFQEEILRYKRAVRNFINYVVENGYAVKTIPSKRRELKNLKPHVQIEIIDRKLDELAVAILSGQTNQLQRVSKLDEIKGLLVDLTITGAIK